MLACVFAGVGYWHSKNRYSTQQQITDAAAGFASRGINVSVIVIDYNHWPRMGDFKFDPKSWRESRDASLSTVSL